MKTSNKILLFIGISLCASTFINAYVLKQKVKNKEYTLATYINGPDKSKTEFVNVTPTDSIHIIGGKVLTVEIVKSDSASIEKEQGTDIEIFKENGKLIIKTPDPVNASSQYSGHVMIKIPSLKAVSFEKKSIIRKVVNKNQTRSSEYSHWLVEATLPYKETISLLLSSKRMPEVKSQLIVPIQSKP